MALGPPTMAAAVAAFVLVHLTCAAAGAAPAQEACHTAIKGEKCFDDVWWAMHYGINEHPAWYPTLTKASSIEDFQALLFKDKKGVGSCGKPCKGVAHAAATTAAPADSTAAPTPTEEPAASSTQAPTSASTTSPSTTEVPTTTPAASSEASTTAAETSTTASPAAKTTDAKLRAVDPTKPVKRIDLSSTSETMSCSIWNQTFDPPDMVGNPVSTEDNVTACQARCQMASGCVHFSFFVPEGRCHLHGVEAVAKPDSPMFISGPSGCHKDEISAATKTLEKEAHECFEANTAYVPTLISNEVGSITECQLLCERQGIICAHFSFGTESGTCRIAGAGSFKVDTDNFVAGPPSCHHSEVTFMRKFLGGRGGIAPEPEAAGSVLATALFAASVLGAALVLRWWRQAAARPHGSSSLLPSELLDQSLQLVE